MVEENWFQKKRVFLSIALEDTPHRQTVIEWMRHLGDRYVTRLRRLPNDEARLAWLNPHAARAHDRSLISRSWDLLRDDPLPIQWIAVSLVREFPGAYPAWGQLGGAAFRVEEDELSGPAIIELDLERVELGGELTVSWQEELLDWACRVFSDYNGLSGFVTLDVVAASVYARQSPYEVAVQASCPRRREDYAKTSRGYYWGNFISKAQVDALGGSSRLKSNSAFDVRPLRAGSYFVRATEQPLAEFSAADLQPLREYFAPLLPTGYRRLQEYSGPPHFVL